MAMVHLYLTEQVNCYERSLDEFRSGLTPFEFYSIPRTTLFPISTLISTSVRRTLYGIHQLPRTI